MNGRGKLRTLILGFTALMPIAVWPAKAQSQPIPATVPTQPSPGKNDDTVLLRNADTGIYDTDKNVVTVRGHVEIVYQNHILKADSVNYDIDADKLTADGHVTLTDDKGNETFAEHVELTDRMRDGILAGFGALLDKSGRLAAKSATRTEAGRITTALKAVYTNCKVCEKPGKRTPFWQIKAFRVVHDKETKRIVFDHATLDILNVPVLYTPYFSMPDPSVDYASGLLTPDAGSSSTIGYFVRIPYYFSISPSEDATLEPLISTKGGMVLMGEYRKRWQNSGLWLQGSLGENPNGGISENQSQYYTHLFGSGRFALSDDYRIGEGWQTGFDAAVTLKDTYLKRYDISQTDRLINDWFVTNETGRSRFSVTGYAFQSLRIDDDNKTFPIVLPLIDYTYIPMEKWWNGQFKLNVNTVAVSRDIGTNDQRLTVQTSWERPYVADNGQLWTFRLSAKGDLFHTDAQTDPTDSHYVFRGTPSVALDWRWPFAKEAADGRSVVLEPIAQIVGTPYGGNKKAITNEDSYDLEIDDNNLFSFDHVPGHDLSESGSRANLGLRTQGRFAGGYIEALVGKAFWLKSDSVYAEDSGQSGTGSDIISRFSIKFPPYVDLTQRLAFDEKGNKIRRNEVYLTGNYGRSGIQISYLNLEKTSYMPKREEINGQMDVNVYENWQIFAAVRSDLIAHQTLGSEYGLGYETECFGITLTYRQKYTLDRDLKPSSAFLVQFNLKTNDRETKPFSLFPHDIFSYSRS